MRHYIYVSCAAEDADGAEKLTRELTRYGFFRESPEASAGRAARDALLRAADAVLVVTSPLSETSAAVTGDVRAALDAGKPTLCVSFKENRLDERFRGGDGTGARMIRFPRSGAADELSRADYVHSLYLDTLCRFGSCFSHVRCVDDTAGRAIRQAVAAWSGDPNAAWSLGMMYEKGLGAPRLPSAAAAWIRRAADAGVTDAMIRMGEYLIDGEGTPRDPDEALRLFRAAAARGDVRGTYHVGLCSLYGYGMMPDPENAVRCLTEATNAGYTMARYRLALLYRDGIGTPRSWSRAVRHLYVACAELTGYVMPDTRPGAKPAPDPMTVLPLMDRRPASRRGTSFSYHCITLRQMRVKRLLASLDPAKYPAGDPGANERAKRCFSKCRAHRVIYREDEWLRAEADPERDSSRYNKKQTYGHQRWDVSLAAGALGRLLEQGSPADGIRPAPLQALRWYRRAMERGHSGAMFRLGDCYRRGVGVPCDRRMAVDLYQRAALLHNERGQFALGVCYEKGDGVPRDPAAAAHWYEKAAREGYAPAQNNLGGCYEYGVGVPQDMLAAVEWYTRAATAGQPDAACRLGLCYELGKGVTADLSRACRLYEQAAQKDHSYAAYRLGLFCDRGLFTGAPSDGTSVSSAAASLGAEVDVEPESRKNQASSPAAGGSLPAGGASAPRFASAAHLYERAARRGVADAAYALGLCFRNGRGLRRDGVRAYEWFCAAAERGSIQGAYEAGLCAFEGRDAIRNASRALECFERAAALWKDRNREADALHELLPVDGMPAAEAAGLSSYMLGYAALNGLVSAGEDMTLPAVLRAKAHFESAASVGNVAAMTALGDLYVFGLLRGDGSVGRAPGSAADLLQTCTAEAWAAAEPYYAAAAESPVSAGSQDAGRTDAILSLASGWRARALAAEADVSAMAAGSVTEETSLREAEERAADAWSRVWRLLTEANKAGSAEAAIRMAECAYYGRGTAADAEMAAGLLTRAGRMPQESVKALLWSGTLCESQAQAGLSESSAADGHEAFTEAAGYYRRAAVGQAGGSVSRSGQRFPYALREREELRSEAARAARAEAKYRLAVLLAGSAGADAERGAQTQDGESFRCLAGAVLDGHASAERDLALMYAQEAARQAAGEADGAPGRARRRQLRQAAREAAAAARSRTVGWAGLIGRSAGAFSKLREPSLWMKEYYTVRPADVEPFIEPSAAVKAVSSAAKPSELAEALNYLGDCLFSGVHLPSDPPAAVSCWRRAASVEQGRGEPPCGGILWAQYSLGWCLLNGVGAARDERQAVAWLTRCAKLHAHAAFLLAGCFENGVGVDAPNDREAIKYYRRALSLGFRPAASRLSAAERRLKKALEEK